MFTTGKKVEIRIKIMKDVLQSKTIKEMIRLASNLYRLGWDERNGGNISILLDEEEAKEYIPEESLRKIPLAIDSSYLKGRYIAVTGTGKYFKNLEYEPEENMGIVRIEEDGKTASIVWGFAHDGLPTSEFPTHLLNHIVCLKKNPKHHVVIHTHPTYTIAMSLCMQDEDEITRTLWKVQTESIVVFPEGIGYVPWMVCGGEEIGIATSKKAEEYRAIIWGMHGIFGTGSSIDEAFGLIETIEKAAQIYFIAQDHITKTITNEELKELAKAFKIDYKKII